eukprot:CAMPEP_0119518156 /NCGR_PEP_ID=MMETSP1344-20130328/34839_1 /TAXON_ID=236787 /ORGANISM="Florenciella parvula, Strain CCMP2471" /LENGTH=158 /DNA_ID=CAMNT_0007555807 /DNA_START=116 /DNA_END=589 /DNA_ORIENTATION=+
MATREPMAGGLAAAAAARARDVARCNKAHARSARLTARCPRPNRDTALQASSGDFHHGRRNTRMQYQRYAVSFEGPSAVLRPQWPWALPLACNSTQRAAGSTTNRSKELSRALISALSALSPNQRPRALPSLLGARSGGGSPKLPPPHLPHSDLHHPR